MTWAIRWCGEILTGSAFVTGWLLLTWAAASLLVWQVWPASIGALLISCGGWKLLGTMAREGLYALMRKGR
mgnify:CR=1 FL=1